MNPREELAKLLAEWLVDAPSDGYGQIDATKTAEYLAERFQKVDITIEEPEFRYTFDRSIPISNWRAKLEIKHDLGSIRLDNDR